MQYTLTELTKGLEVTIKGDPGCLISGVCPIQQSQPAHITFLTNALYRKYLETTEAAAVILSEADANVCPVIAIISHNPYYTYSQIAAFFVKQNKLTTGVHSTAVIGEGTRIHPSASIGPHCVIGARVNIAAYVVLGAGCIVGEGVQVGENTQLDARVTLYHHVKIGKHVRLASGCVIGSEGFGFANQANAWHKVPQLGSVDIGDEVDIGANTTIDRGAVEDTVIEQGVKLDNLIQIGHNVHIGAHTIMAGCTAIAGSVTIGKHCMIGGGACFAGHIQICDHVIITGMTAVTKSILEPGIYSSGIVGAVPNREFHKNNARFHRLGELIQRVKVLEKELKNKERDT